MCGQIELKKLKNVKDWNGQNSCGRDFASKAGLEDHIRTQHQGLVGKPRRKESRDQPNTHQENGGASGIAMLTGVDYGGETGRDIYCIVSTCPYRFYRNYDLEIHLESMHAMPPADVTEAITEYNALSGGPFWIGGIEQDEEFVTQGIRPLDAQSISDGNAPLLDSFDDGATEAFLDPQLA